MPSGNSYRKIKEHVSLLAKECHRDPNEITLLSVSKNFTWDQISSAYQSGCRNFGESKVQEALSKIEEAPKDILWHFIGNLQKNKVKKIIGKMSLIHSVDSLSLAEKISECSQNAEIITPILLQVNSSGEKTKNGLKASEWIDLFSTIETLPSLLIEGLMTMAPLTDDYTLIRKCFRETRELLETLNSMKKKNLLHHLSMGMSNDYPIAIQEGATIIRVGSAIFGER